MIKQTVEFAVQTNNGIVTCIGKSTILQPVTHFKGGEVKWFDDSKLLKKNYSTTTIIEPVISLKTNSINDVFKAMLQIPLIKTYLMTHDLINEAVISNECYSIVYEDIEKANKGCKTTINVFLHQNNMAC